MKCEEAFKRGAYSTIWSLKISISHYFVIHRFHLDNFPHLHRADIFQIPSSCQKLNLHLSGTGFKLCQVAFCLDPSIGFAVHEGIAILCLSQMTTFLVQHLCARFKRLRSQLLLNSNQNVLCLLGSCNQSRRKKLVCFFFSFSALISYVERKLIAQCSAFLTQNFCKMHDKVKIHPKKFHFFILCHGCR